jgi:hypothetical protein
LGICKFKEKQPKLGDLGLKKGIQKNQKLLQKIRKITGFSVGVNIKD